MTAPSPSAPHGTTDPPLHRDPWVWAAIAVALVLRALPMLVWGWQGPDCTRDECIYKHVTAPILRGDGLGLAPKGWLPAPLYPYLLATSKLLFGSFEAVKWVQWLLAVPTIAVMAALGAHVAQRPGARAMAWAMALHPTFIFYTGTMWTESVYTLLLWSAVLATLQARRSGPSMAIVAGALLGLNVLLRGVATWMAPVFLAALMWPTHEGSLSTVLRRRARHAWVFVATALLVVGPYSLHASRRWGGPVITDATAGHVLWLGNDRFDPVTFDYAIGQLTGPVYGATLRRGRIRCGADLDPIALDRCKVDGARREVLQHPGTFLRRIPQRLAQLVNPHSFLTRHLRWNLWPGIPWQLKELIIAAQALSSVVIVAGGAAAAALRARGALGVLVTGIVGYHVAVISLAYGLSRFRLPLEPAGMIFLVALIWGPRRSPSSPARRVLAGLLAAAALGLQAVYLPTGFLSFIP